MVLFILKDSAIDIFQTISQRKLCLLFVVAIIIWVIDKSRFTKERRDYVISVF